MYLGVGVVVVGAVDVRVVVVEEVVGVVIVLVGIGLVLVDAKVVVVGVVSSVVSPVLRLLLGWLHHQGWLEVIETMGQLTVEEDSSLYRRSGVFGGRGRGRRGYCGGCCGSNGCCWSGG